MQKDKQEAGIGLPEIGVSLDELVRRGARQVIQQVIELELDAAELAGLQKSADTLKQLQASIDSKS